MGIMIKKSFIVSAIFVFSTLVQLISQIVVTRLFGATFDLDVFLAAVALPTIIVTVIYGTLNDVLLPLLGDKKSSGENNLDFYFSKILINISLIVTAFSLLIYFFSFSFSHLLYGSRGEVFVQAVARQMSFMSLSYPLAIITTFFGAYFYLHKNFIRFPLVQLIGSTANVLFILVFSKYFGIWSLVYAFILNLIIQVIFIIRPEKIKLFAGLKFTRSGTGNFLIAWLPLLIGYLALRSDILLVRSLGSTLPEGSLVRLNLIFRIFSLATSIMSIGFQIVLLPQLVEDFNLKNFLKSIFDVRKFKFITLGISLVVTMFTVMLTPYLIRLLFVGGKFTASDASQTLAFIPFFILPAVGWGINNIFFQPLIALKKQKELGILNIFAFALAWVVGSVLIKFLPPQFAITASLLTLLFTGIIGSEILWQYYKKALLLKK